MNQNQWIREEQGAVTTVKGKTTSANEPASAAATVAPTGNSQEQIFEAGEVLNTNRILT
jgi:hypothetical protein